MEEIYLHMKILQGMLTRFFRQTKTDVQRLQNIFKLYIIRKDFHHLLWHQKQITLFITEIVRKIYFNPIQKAFGCNKTITLMCFASKEFIF